MKRRGDEKDVRSPARRLNTQFSREIFLTKIIDDQKTDWRARAGGKTSS